MRRRARVAVALALGAAALGAAVARGLARGGAGVPTAVATRAPLARRVRAEGVLKPETPTPLVAPGSDMGFKIGWIVDDGARVKAGDVVVRFDPSETEKALLAGRDDESTVDARSSKERSESGAAIANLGRDADQARRELETARTFQSRDPELYSRREIVEADIDVDLASHREENARQVRTIRRELSEANLDLLGIDRKKAGLKVGKAEKELASLEVKAPHDGIVVLTRDWKGDTPQVGQSVWSGFPLAEIPDLDRLVAEVFVLEADAGGLTAGRKATVTVESRPDRPVAATVKKVDTLAKPRFRGVPVQYFGATLAIEGLDPSSMKPGQRVVALLDLSEERPVLSVPRQAVLERSGKKVVLRKKGGRFVPVEVELGTATLARVAVTSGLSEGDVVALDDPERRPTSGPGASGAPSVPAPGAGR